MSDEPPPFRKLLVANRGEIALRVIRAARDLGIRTVAVYSDVDAALPHVRFADEAHCIGPAPAAQSYLDSERILAVARATGADAVHPGYGFLAENAAFARACADAGLTFVGPSPASIEGMGDKIASRRTAQAAGVPIIPGTFEPLRDPHDARRLANEIGYPLLIKAVAGGGGTGIRLVQREEEIERAMATAREEARAALGEGALYLEKLLQPARHVEIQLVADQHGHCEALGERDCSVQRRRQKLIEESPSTALAPDLRRRMEEAAKTVARACDYTSVGTVEFLVYDSDRFAFLEMNTRLQVEHTVTELVRGVDIVADQIRIAAGRPLGYTAAQRPAQGWAIECRITAEDPYNGFLPGVGPLPYYREPAGPGIRVDSMLHPGMEVTAHYDSLLAKLIAWGPDRETCRRRLLRALREFTVVGVATSIPFHLALLADPHFIAGEITTDYVERTFHLNRETQPETTELAAIAAAAYLRRYGEHPHLSTATDGASGRPWRTAARGRRGPWEQGWQRGAL